MELSIQRKILHGRHDKPGARAQTKTATRPLLRRNAFRCSNAREGILVFLGPQWRKENLQSVGSGDTFGFLSSFSGIQQRLHQNPEKRQTQRRQKSQFFQINQCREIGRHLTPTEAMHHSSIQYNSG